MLSFLVYSLSDSPLLTKSQVEDNFKLINYVYFSKFVTTVCLLT